MKATKILVASLAAAMLASMAAVSVSAVEEEEPSTYLLMNIPYSEFYQADVNNDIPVDVFTSATKAKPRTVNLAAGSYHTDSSGDAINGITFPVKVSGAVDLSAFEQVTDSDSLEITVSTRGKENTTVFSGKETLFERADYAYYVLDTVPGFYKEVTQNADGSLSFGETQGAVQTIEAEAELTTESKYGDYQLNIISDALTSTEDKTVTVYGVVLETEEGASYGLRHLENIWRNTSLAWSTGFTDEVHGCVTSSAHYEKMMGQTIDKVIYYTDEGIKSFDTALYVPVKTGASAEADNAAVADGQTTFTTDSFAEDFVFDYAVTNDADEAVTMTVADHTITYASDMPNGKYTLTIADAAGKYASVLTSFELTVPAPAQFNGNIVSEAPALIAAEGASEEDFAGFLENIAQVTVNENTYSATGKGSVQLIDTETGLLDISNTDVFSEDTETFEVTVKATGYDPFGFTLSRVKSETDEPSSQPTDEPSEPSAEEPSSQSTEETEPSTPATSVPDTQADTSDTSPVIIPSNGTDVPKTADTTATGVTLVLAAVSAGAVLLLKKKGENEQ